MIRVKVIAMLALSASALSSLGQQQPQRFTPLTPKTPVDMTSIELPLAKAEAISLRITMYQQQVMADAKEQAQQQIAQGIAPLQSEFAHWNGPIQAWIDKVKRDNGWGEDVKFDLATKTFVRILAERQPTQAPPAQSTGK